MDDFAGKLSKSIQTPVIRSYSLQPEDEEANRKVLQEEKRVEEDIVKFREGGYRAAVSVLLSVTADRR